jgi:hypothetical protein
VADGDNRGVTGLSTVGGTVYKYPTQGDQDRTHRGQNKIAPRGGWSSLATRGG